MTCYEHIESRLKLLRKEIFRQYDKKYGPDMPEGILMAMTNEVNQVLSISEEISKLFQTEEALNLNKPFPIQKLKEMDKKYREMLSQ